MADNPIRDAVAEVGRSEPIVAVGRAIGDVGDRVQSAARSAYDTAKDYYQRFTRTAPTKPPRKTSRDPNRRDKGR